MLILSNIQFLGRIEVAAAHSKFAQAGAELVNLADGLRPLTLTPPLSNLVAASAETARFARPWSVNFQSKCQSRHTESESST